MTMTQKQTLDEASEANQLQPQQPPQPWVAEQLEDDDTKDYHLDTELVVESVPDQPSHQQQQPTHQAKQKP
jgi:hypothetical protein